MKRLAISAAVAAVVLMVWGFVYWTLLPTSSRAVSPLPPGSGVPEAIAAGVPESGVYVYPWPAGESPEAVEEFAAAHREGPIAMVTVQRQGAEPMDPSLFLFGFLHFLASAVLVGLLLHIALPVLPGYGARLGFVTLAGVFAAVAVELSKPVWWYVPWEFHVVYAFFTISGWLLAGLAMAAIQKPARRVAT